MPADVFSQDNQRAVDIEDGGGVNPAGPREVSLGTLQLVGHLHQPGDVEMDCCCFIERRELLTNEVDAGLATQTAAR